MRIKAITLWQPWATLMAIGAKYIETRSWRTNYTGPMAIHAAKRWKEDQISYTMQPEVARPLKEAGYDPIAHKPLPLGKVVGVGLLVGYTTTKKAVRFLKKKGDPKHQIVYGNFTHGRHAWYFKALEQLPQPIPEKGNQGLWYWTVPSTLNITFNQEAATNDS